MVETIIVGKATSPYSYNNIKEFARRDNLLKAHNCVDTGDHFSVEFKYIDHSGKGPQEVKLIYKILK